jgi:hypothetical protein
LFVADSHKWLWRNGATNNATILRSKDLEQRIRCARPGGDLQRIFPLPAGHRRKNRHRVAIVQRGGQVGLAVSDGVEQRALRLAGGVQEQGPKGVAVALGEARQQLRQRAARFDYESFTRDTRSAPKLGEVMNGDLHIT